MITRAFPIHHEFTARPAAGRDIDLILICRKEQVANNYFKETIEEIKNSLWKLNKISKDKWEEDLASLLPYLSFLHSSEPSSYILSEIIKLKKS